MVNMNINPEAVVITEWDASTKALMPVENDFSTHQFSAGEPHLNFAVESLAGRHFVVEVSGGDLGHLAAALVYKDGLTRKGAETVTLFIPYLPGARQDRAEPFTAKVVAGLINSGGFDNVIAVDPHSPVLPGMVDNFFALDMLAIIPPAVVEGDVTIIAPDAGAHDRALYIADAYGLPAVHAEKHRDPAKKFAIASYECPKIETSRAVVIDDICDGGGTFMALASAIDVPTEGLSLWTTHGIYSKGVAALHEHYSLLATTTSLPSSEWADLTVPLDGPLTNALTSLIK